MMNDELKSLAKEYVDKVEHVCLLLLEGLNLKTKSDLWKYRRAHYIPEINLNDNKYEFHGRGCRFSSKDMIIDWDFGCSFGSRWCGINPGLFSYYIKENHKDLFELYSWSKIQNGFEQAVISGEMVKKADLYFFKIPITETFASDFHKEFDTLIIDDYNSQWIIKRNKMVDRFIRKSRRILNLNGEGTDVYILSFFLNDRKVFSIPYGDVGYPIKAVTIMEALMRENKEVSKNVKRSNSC
ncbi:MAG TPA: hypothetical protein VIO64_05300 [Pseudobacteroides sp.]|uniref:DUF6896 domain-containing protein n=1 Tax=Pseudobacteroides sp. TaxID=1968840 RepID=UPI002F92A2A6